MNNHPIKQLMLSLCCTFPLQAIAGGIEIIDTAQYPNVDIPQMRPGYGFVVEGSWIRPYNNNLNYAMDSDFISIKGPFNLGLEATNRVFSNITPLYGFALGAGVNYVFEDKANVIKLYYEHLFSRQGSDSYGNLQTLLVAQGDVEDKYDGISLVSEQHILIGPYWETTFTGGARFAHLRQNLSAYQAVFGASGPESATAFAGNFNSQFNGVGPMLGFGSIFLITDKLEVGAEALGALLIGNSNVSATGNIADLFLPSESGFALSNTASPDSIHSIVPELFYKLYMNYFHRFNDGSQIQFEAGWRANQFFNVRTFKNELMANASNLNQPNAVQGPRTNDDDSDTIGFSGPYFMVNYKL